MIRLEREVLAPARPRRLRYVVVMILATIGLGRVLLDLSPAAVGAPAIAPCR